MRAPSNWSIVTVGAPMAGSPPTTTSGMSPSIRATASTTRRTGATTMTPWTCDARRRSSVAAMSLPLRLRVTKLNRWPASARRRLDPEEHVRRPELLGLDRHHAQRARAPAGEDAGGRVGVVAEGGHRLLDAPPCRLGHPGEPVQHAGHRHDRDARLLGDVRHDGAARRFDRHAPSYSNQSNAASPPTAYIAEHATEEPSGHLGREVASVELAERVRRAVLVLEAEGDGVGPMGVRTRGDGQDDGARRAGRVRRRRSRTRRGPAPRRGRRGRRRRSARSRPARASLRPRRRTRHRRGP